MRKPSGFTIIEMLITFGILAVMSTLSVAGFRTGARADELRIDSQLLAAEFRRAQTSVIAGVTMNVCTGGTLKGRLCPKGLAAECGNRVDLPGGIKEEPACQVSVPPGGYGIHVDAVMEGKEVTMKNRAIVFFADADNDHIMDKPVGSKPGEAVRTVYLSSNVYIAATEPVHPQGQDKGMDVVFSPPDGQVWIQGSNSEPLAKITLRHRALDTPEHTADKYVTIMTLSGQISTY